MGRFGVGASLEGVVKSIQHISGTRGSNGTTNVSITAVSNTNKAYVIMASQSSSQYGNQGNDVPERSGGSDSLFGVQLTSTTNVAVSCPNLDMFSGYTMGNRTGTFKGSVVEIV